MNRFSQIRDILSMSGSEFENACRHYTSYAYLGDHTGLCNILTKYKAYIDTRDIGVAPHFIMDGFWEAWLTYCMAERVQPGDVCIDIGANFGYFSLLMAELAGPDGKTIAVEPHPHIAKLLRQTQSIHGWRFTVLEEALSDKPGEAYLAIPFDYAGGSTIKTDHWFEPQEKVKVRQSTVDELVWELGLAKVNFIKMDVEGVEPEVLAGMSRTIEENPGLQIIIEFSPFFYKNPVKFSEFLLDRFIVYRVKDVEQITELDDESMKAMREQLLHAKAHTDLLLVRK